MDSGWDFCSFIYLLCDLGKVSLPLLSLNFLHCKKGMIIVVTSQDVVKIKQETTLFFQSASFSAQGPEPHWCSGNTCELKSHFISLILAH